MPQYDLSVKGKMNKFDRDNGNDAVVIGNWYVFSNGARREVNPYGAWCDPPEKEYDRLNLAVKYHTVLLESAEAAFQEAKQRMLDDTQTGVQPEAAEIKQVLGGLLSKVRARRAKLKEVKSQLDQTPEAKQKRSAQRYEAIEAEERERALAVIQKFRL